MKRYSKDQIYKHYENTNFPEDIISKDAKNLKDILFDEKKQIFIDETMLYGNGNDSSINRSNLLSESFYDYKDTQQNKNPQKENNKFSKV